MVARSSGRRGGLCWQGGEALAALQTASVLLCSAIGVLCVVSALGIFGAALPSAAGAYAALEGPPVFSSTPGLPDGRVYEQVSPADKNGNQAGSGTTAVEVGALDHYGLASADGNAVLFEGTGPMGESPWGASEWFVATKNASAPGWSTRALLPSSPEALQKLGGIIGVKESYIDPSPDLSHALVVASYKLSTEGCASQVYLTGPDPFDAAVWLEQPQIEDPVLDCPGESVAEAAGVPVGGTPDFSTVYFTYAGTLVPADAPRTPHAGTGQGVEAWGFYEFSAGVVHEAGVLPDGSVDAFGAVPADSGHGKTRTGNEVSADGTRAFFVSPDPASCSQNGGHNDCTADPPELYVRENGSRTLLVSKDTLLPETAGLPGAAPHGVLPTPSSTANEPVSAALAGAYVFASPDGSQAFFQSDDKLTPTAPEGPPQNTTPKTYDFNLDTGVLTYLPNVEGELLATDGNGSSLAFLRPETGGAPAELDLWRAGASGGSVTPVVQLPGPPSSGGNQYELRKQYVSEVDLAVDGSVLVFITKTPLSPAFNSGGFEQIYRYDVGANSLGCISCAPVGVHPRGDASMSVMRADETYEQGFTEAQSGIVDERGISANGDRIFFDSPDPLVAQDVNTDSPPVETSEAGDVSQGRDVYEWEDGVVYLISTGRSPRDSFLVDSSEDGSDVFFATAEGLVPGDTDGGFDVYDARVPRAGDTVPPSPSPCEGLSCQGPSNTLSPLSVSGSSAFSGLGNLAPEVTPPPPTSSAPKTAKCKKGYVRKKNKCVKTKLKKKAKKASNDKRATNNRRVGR
jgi:hypothetical protein